ncbi:MAG: SusF/SusE family outer membrane protein [Candidatus Cryptobacteroides sp.]
MKRILFSLMSCAATALALVSCQQKVETPDNPDEGNKDNDGITNIYIYGSATQTGLNLETMEAFSSIGGGLYTWEGYLSSGAPFQFPLQKTSAYPCLVISEDGQSLIYAETEEDLSVYTVDVSGEYEIIIDCRDKDNLGYSLVLTRADMSELEITELYILGDATATGWALDAMEQFSEEDGIFTWEGPLMAEKRFRFPLQKIPDTWWPCLMAGENGKILLGTCDEDEVNTPVAENGVYRIVIDTKNREDITYTITLVSQGIPDPEITVLYMFGDATVGGWDLTAKSPFENNDGIFTWTGKLKASGVFRMNTSEGFFPAIVLEKGTTKAVYCVDWYEELYDQFSVAEDGEYTVVVDARQWDAITYTITPYEGGEESGGEEGEGKLVISELYILGDATENAWALDTMPAFTNDNGIFTWQGNLKSTGDFRFPTQRIPNVWWPCLEISSDGSEIWYDADGSKHPVNPYRVSADGVYLIVIDAKDIDNLSYTITKVE